MTFHLPYILGGQKIFVENFGCSLYQWMIAIFDNGVIRYTIINYSTPSLSEWLIGSRQAILRTHVFCYSIWPYRGIYTLHQARISLLFSSYWLSLGRRSSHFSLLFDASHNIINPDLDLAGDITSGIAALWGTGILPEHSPDVQQFLLWKPKQTVDARVLRRLSIQCGQQPLWRQETSSKGRWRRR